MPGWRRAFDAVERNVSPRVETHVHSDEFARMTAVIARNRRLAIVPKFASPLAPHDLLRSLSDSHRCDPCSQPDSVTHPQSVAFDLATHAFDDAHRSGLRESRSSYIERTVLPRTLEGRLGHATELSAALIFLANDAGSCITGITLPVEGGMLTS